MVDEHSWCLGLHRTTAILLHYALSNSASYYTLNVACIFVVITTILSQLPQAYAQIILQQLPCSYSQDISAVQIIFLLRVRRKSCESDMARDQSVEGCNSLQQSNSLVSGLLEGIVPRSEKIVSSILAQKACEEE